MTRDELNGARVRGVDRGHYESWFQRANHPTEPLAFWVRYTVFVPDDRGRPALGELWAIVFDGENIVARKSELPLDACQFSELGLNVRIGESTLDAERCQGHADDLHWALNYQSPCPPLLMLPERLYAAGLPKAKLLCGSPLARYRGTITVGERSIDVDDWVGSQNHNWGTRHTDRYAWGQVAGFDEAPDVFFEAATAWLRFGPLWSPPLTIAAVRVGDRSMSRVGIVQALRGSASIDGYRWSLQTTGRNGTIRAEFEADPARFVALRYLNPPAGHKVCLNTKLARCSLTVEGPGIDRTDYRTEHRAALEFLRDASPPELPLNF